ncbi:MAG: SpoIIE family protein phosphatase, partial [Bacteroidetes bacterium]|nr:SpoIIE family protein phosphatase [Bacteroidota bacterium]
MPYIAKRSPRAIRAIFVLAALIVLSITLVNFYMQMYARVQGNDQCRWTDIASSRMLITEIVGGGVAEKAGLKDGDFLLRINGETFKESQVAQRIINANAGHEVTYTIERNGSTFETRILILKSVSLRYLAQFLFGLGFLVVGLVVVLMKPRGVVQQAFGRFAIFSMLFFGLSELSINRNDPPWMLTLLASFFIVGTIMALPSFVRFFMLFPVRMKGYDKRSVTIGLYMFSTLLGAYFVTSTYTRMPDGLTNALFQGRYGFLFAGLFFFIRSYYRYVPHERRRELRPILVGTALAILGFLYAIVVTAVNPFAVFINPTIILPAMVLVIVPVLFGYAIFRYGLMDIDAVVRRTLTYGAVTMSIAAIYLAVVYGIGSLLTDFVNVQDEWMFHLAAIVVIAAAFEPIKGRLQQSIDRLFYRERADYQRALLEFVDELPRKLDLKEILDAMVGRISSTMHIERVAVIICDEKEGCLSVGRNVEPADREFGDAERSLQAMLRTTRKPVNFLLWSEVMEGYNLRMEDVAKLRRADVALSVPMFLKDRLVGFINVGPKMSGRLYSTEDVNLLSTVAAQAAIAIENARLHRSEREKERIQEELALAREIQRGLLPKANPVISGLDVSGVTLPALSVGGDYYDFIHPEPHRFLVVVADVAGKGMSAALYMSKVQGMVQLAAHMYDSPKEMLVNINRRIFEGIDRRSFITMILAQFDLKKKQVRICRAGHTKAIVSKRGKLELLQGAGIALGLERGPVFERQIQEVRMPVGPESLFVFYTDGVTEAMNVHGQQLGEDRMMDVLRLHGKGTAPEI